jgi:hypothetical protein
MMVGNRAMASTYGRKGVISLQLRDTIGVTLE